MGVFVAAFRARSGGRAAPGGVEVATADAVKGGPAALRVETRVVAPVVPQPEAEKQQPGDRTEKDRAGGEVEHGEIMGTRAVLAANLFGWRGSAFAELWRDKPPALRDEKKNPPKPGFGGLK